MPKFEVTLLQFVEEYCKIKVEADTEAEARALVTNSIERNMIDEEYDLDWCEGDGLHHEGVSISTIERVGK